MDSDVHSESSTSFGDVNDSTDENDVMEKCCFGKQVFAVPQAFCVEEEVFNEVLSMGTWQNVLTDKHRERLKKLLPTFPENDEEEKLETLKNIFSGENFKFGNPSKHFFNRLKDGFLTPEVAEVSSALKKASFREYKNQQQQYYYHLLQEILISRKKLLDTAYTLPPDHPVKMQQFTAKPKDATLCERTRLRYFSILQDLREECCEMDTSSEDENYPESSPPKVTRKHKKQLQILEASLSPEMTRITSTTAFPPGYPGSGHFLNRCFDMIEVSEERYREMLLTHKQRRLTEQDHPELDVSKIVLEDMIVRANIAKRPLTKIADGQMKKKCKTQDTPDKIQKLVPVDAEKCSLDVKSPVPPSSLTQQEDSSLTTNGDAKQVDNHISAIQENDIQPDQVTVKVEIEEDQSCENRLASSPCDVPQYPTCFFSLVRDLFCESAEQKLSAVKLEERVRTWQDGSTSIIFDWISFQESWADLVSSALKFLAGDLISILPENFVPFLDYKEKQQQWQWIGSGRDAEEQLFSLCQHWLENKDDVSLDVLETSQGSPPPPRVTTVWTVRPTCEEERKVYREQECVRYQNPHKAFTFKVHGYESVVGPVKGVYGKESGVNKAREHSLLISDRPPFVTILSLVRDAAARLPNGEGTRADICELLKDSQYLAPASDQQIHTVVSGALDRLHYEKDPCVKYDVNRKLWIYLHRNRTEEEFERIHQAQAAAAKARKAVQKIKLPKIKSKDVPRTPPSVSISSTSENGASVLNIDVTASVSPGPSLQSPRGGTSPRTQGSPKQSHPSSNRHLIRSLSMPSQANSKNPATVITECYNAARKQEIQQGAILQSSAVCQPTVTSSTPVSSPQHSNTSNILPQFQSEGNNSRPPSQGSVQSLPSPKTVIANVNAAQFVSVGSLQVGTSSVEQSMPSPTVSSRLHGVLSVDMKPSSPSFVGQPPVLQPVLSHQSVDSTTTLTCVSSAVAPNLMSAVPGTVSKAGNSATFTTQNISNAKTVQGFQTIVIKQDAGPRTGNSISSLPLLSVEEISSTTDSSALNSSPVVARLVHGSQLLSLSNIVAGAAAASNSALKQGPASIQNFKIQGSNFGQQIVPTSALNLLPATQITASGDIKLPRLALVSQQSNAQEAAMITSGSIIGQSKVFSVNQDVIQSTEVKDSLVHKDLSEAKIATLPAQTFSGIRPNISSDISQIIGVTSTPNHIVSSSAISSSCTVSNPSITSVSKNSPPVVIAPQEALKPITPTYVMTAPITSASVITAQQGVRTASPLNVRALQGIKVIPVPQSLAATKNVRTQPLLARIIAPPSGIALRSAAVSSDIVHAHHLKGSSVNIVHGLRSVAPSSHIKKATAQAPTTSQEVPSSQPFIIQVQAPKVTEQEDINLYPKEG